MNYNKEFIDLMYQIKPITNTFGIIKDVQTDTLKIGYKGESIGFILTAPAEYLEFPGDFLGFMDFDRFIKYYNIFNIVNKDEALSDTPLLDYNLNEDQQVGEIVIKSSKGKQKFTYRAGTPTSVRAQKFNGVKLPSIDALFKLTEAQTEHLHKIMSIVKPDLVNFAFNGSTCVVTIANMIFSDSYEIEYTLDNPVETNFSFPVLAESINLIPGGEYNLEVCKKGYIGFHQVRDDKINLELYISKKVER